MTCIADRQHFPLMTIWFVPVDDSAAVLRVNSEVDRPMNVATVRYSSCPDSLEDDVEVVLAHSKKWDEYEVQLRCLLWLLPNDPLQPRVTDRSPDQSRGAITVAACADGITGNISNSTRSLQRDIHCPRSRGSSHSMIWKHRRKSSVTQLSTY